MLKILCYKNQGIHWYPCHPTFLWKINFTLVRRLISALIWDISGQWNHSDGWDFREKQIVFSRFLTILRLVKFLKKLSKTIQILEKIKQHQNSFLIILLRNLSEIITFYYKVKKLFAIWPKNVIFFEKNKQRLYEFLRQK